MDTTYIGTVRTGFGQVWTVRRNGAALWVTDSDGVILERSDLASAILAEYERNERIETEGSK